MSLSQIRQNAAQRLREDGNPFRKLVFIHTAVTLALSLSLMIIIWLSQYIAPEGGLSNMGTQTLLSAGQTLLQLLSMILVPFWNAGLSFAVLGMIRRRSISPVHLTEGFRRWGSVASSLLLQGLVCFVTAMGCSFACSLLLSLMPLPSFVYQDLAAFVEAPTVPLSRGVHIFLIIYLVTYGAALCVLLIPKLYQYRLAAYRIMEDEPCSGLQAIVYSRQWMKGNRRKLFLLDLSFWWFYLLDFGISLLSMGDLIASEFGAPLPFSQDFAAWIFPIMGMLARLVLYWFAKPQLEVSYGLFYEQAVAESLKEPEPPQPKRMPWKY